MLVIFGHVDHFSNIKFLRPQIPHLTQYLGILVLWLLLKIPPITWLVGLCICSRRRRSVCTHGWISGLAKNMAVLLVSVRV